MPTDYRRLSRTANNWMRFATDASYWASDPVTPQCKALADLLRKKVKGLQAEHEKAYKQAQDALTANDSWQQLDATEQEAVLGKSAYRLLPNLMYRVTINSPATSIRGRCPPSRLRLLPCRRV